MNGQAANGAGTTSNDTDASFTIGTHTSYSEAQNASQSGLLSSTLVREQAVLGGSSCGSFGSPVDDHGHAAAEQRRRDRGRQLLPVHADGHRQREQHGQHLDDRAGRRRPHRTSARRRSRSRRRAASPTTRVAEPPCTTTAQRGRRAASRSTRRTSPTPRPASSRSRSRVSPASRAEARTPRARSPRPTRGRRSSASGTQTVSATNGFGSSSNTAFTLVRDVTAPAGGALTVNGAPPRAAPARRATARPERSRGARTDYAETQSASRGRTRVEHARAARRRVHTSDATGLRYVRRLRRRSSARLQTHGIADGLLPLHAHRYRQRRQRREHPDDGDRRHDRTDGYDVQLGGNNGVIG